MAWKQLKTPNIDVLGYSGGCLQYVDDGVNPPHRQPTAQDSWNYAVNTGVAHPLEEPPSRVWVPVYYTIENGPWAGYGHVAWFYNDGNNTVIYDSEYGCGNRRIPYSSGSDLFAYMGWKMSYLGWAEAVDGMRMVQYEAGGNSNNEYYKPAEGEIDMYLIQIVDTTGKHKGKWYISNGVQCRYVRTPRMLDNYKNAYGKLNLRIDRMYSTELFTEFGGEGKIL